MNLERQRPAQVAGEGQLVDGVVVLHHALLTQVSEEQAPSSGLYLYLGESRERLIDSDNLARKGLQTSGQISPQADPE